MTTRPTLVRKVAPLPDAQLMAVRKLMVDAMVNRGFPAHDAEDVVQDVLEKITRNPARFAERLAALDRHAGYFVETAFNTYRMRLRSERRRRLREERHWSGQDELGTDNLNLAVAGEVDGATLLALAEGSPLTPLQRRYLEAVLIEHLWIDDIATLTNTSERAVRAVLKRAVDGLRRHRLRRAA